MVTSLMSQPFVPSEPVTDRAALGLLLSSLTVIAEAFVDSPAVLVHEPLTGVPDVSVVSVWAALQVVGSLMASMPEALTVTSLVYQPAVPRVPLVTARAAEGPVLSTLTETGLAGVDRPAALVQVALKGAPVVSVVWVWSAVQVTPPLRAS